MVHTPERAKYDEVFEKLLHRYAGAFWLPSTEYLPSKEYFSPYAVVFQSSMTGKSRMLNEIAETRLFTVFLCLRNKSKNMQPVRSVYVADALDRLKPESADEFMSLLVQTYIREFIERVNTTRLNGVKQITCENWRKHQAAVVDKKVGRVLSNPRSKPSMGSLNWASVSADLEHFDKSKGVELLFVFDEARSLLEKTDKEGRNLFRYLMSPAWLETVCTKQYSVYS